VTISRTQPLDWSRAAGRPAKVRPEAVSVIVPVYGAAADLERCLASVAAQTDLACHDLILVIDGPQGDAVEAIVRSFSSSASQILRDDTRCGFVVSVNRGMRATAGDVVLLNSDTIVTPQWLEKLIDASVSSGDIGTVTPLSNNATLCSVPRSFEENLIPAGFDAASFAALVERVSVRAYPRLPTGVGVCLYIRRALLDDIGFFDEEHFGLGYGEENDFCMRALARGWLHIADDATFIAHVGHRSFGSSSAALQRKAARAMKRLHPAYVSTIARFMKDDPLSAVRKRIIDALRLRTDQPPLSRTGESDLRKARGGPRKILHLVHGWPPFQHAGTELYAYWLVQRQRQWRDVSVFTRLTDATRRQDEGLELMDGAVRVRLVTNNFVQRNPIARNALRDAVFEKSFERFVIEEKPDLIHIHHLAGHAFSLARVARRLNIPVVQQIQDWWFLCARANLFDYAWQRCSGPSVSKCARCAPMTRVAPAPLWNRALHLARRSAARRALAVADAFVMGSHFIHDDYVRAGLLPSDVPAFVLPYGVETAERKTRRASRRPLRFGFVGSILPHKGLHIAAEAFRGIEAAKATLHAWGDASASTAYTQMLRELGGDSLTLEGTFAEDEKPAVFDSIDVLLVPSIGLESFGLAAREAMARGVPVVASRDGGLLEMFERGVCGELFPSGDAASLREIILRLAQSPEIIDEWSARIPPIKSIDEHAEEIEAVYESVMARRR
jgi:glycosyltransferase involved in cell wall biosynthesis/GT2 family glycosyltransferase